VESIEQQGTQKSVNIMSDNTYHTSYHFYRRKNKTVMVLIWDTKVDLNGGEYYETF